MTDDLTYNSIGTVTVTIDGTEYRLGRPKMKQYRYFTRRLGEMSQEAQDKLNALSGAVQTARALYDEDPSDENKAVHELAVTKLEDFAATPFYETSSELVREMFKQLSDHPLPDDLDDWPAWLAADVSLPGTIIAHWRKAPKASGPPPTG
jgi:hypothetical protein